MYFSLERLKFSRLHVGFNEFLELVKICINLVIEFELSP